MNALLIGVALTIGAPALKGPIKGDRAIEGLWILTEYISSGANVGFQQGTSVEFLPDGKRIWRNGPGEPGDERAYKLLSKSSPPAMDLIRYDGPGMPPTVHSCIYKIDGDKLIITIGLVGADRPSKHEVGAMVMKYKRAKKE